jgi:hypothetical protein
MLAPPVPSVGACSDSATCGDGASPADDRPVMDDVTPRAPRPMPAPERALGVVSLLSSFIDTGVERPFGKLVPDG